MKPPLLLSMTEVGEFGIAGVFAAGLLIAAAMTDIRQHKIYNCVTYPAMLVGLGLGVIGSCSLGGGWLGELSFARSLLGLAGCGVLMFIPFHCSGGGAGDVKLAMAVGSLVGFTPTLQGFCVGYVVAAGYLILRSIWVLIPQWSMVWHVAFLNISPSTLIAAGRDHAVASASISRPLPLGGFFLVGMALIGCWGPLW